VNSNTYTKSFTQPENPGDYFLDGMLHRMLVEGVHVIRVWPEPCSRVKYSGRRWRVDRKRAETFFSEYLHLERVRPPAEPPIPVDLPPIPQSPEISQVLAMFGGVVVDPKRRTVERQNAAAYAAWRYGHDMADFFKAIPPDVRKIVLCYEHHRWEILNLLANCPAASELHASNPALFFMLANHRVFKSGVKAPLRVIGGLIRRPQRLILAWLGFPPSETVRKSLAKIIPGALVIADLQRLRKAVRAPAVRKMLGHVPSINAGVLKLVLTTPTHSHVTPRLLAEVAADSTHDTYSDIHHVLEETIEIGQTEGGCHCPSSFSSLQRLYQVHDHLAGKREVSPDDLIFEMLYGTRPDEVPEPPYPGNEDVIPLRSVRAMFKEGTDMEHCAGFRSENVIGGNCYLYKVLHPVRATAELVRHHQTWSLGYIHGVRNAAIPKYVAKEVQSAIFGEQEAYAGCYGTGLSSPGRLEECHCCLPSDDGLVARYSRIA